jgi:hypothetical protein
MTQTPSLKEQFVECFQFAYGGICGGLFAFFVLQTISTLTGIPL